MGIKLSTFITNFKFMNNICKKLVFIELNEINLDIVKKYSLKLNLKFFDNFFLIT